MKRKKKNKPNFILFFYYVRCELKKITKNKMTLFFDTKVQFLDSDAVSTECSWHASHPLFAVASFHQDRGACVTIFDDSVRK